MPTTNAGKAIASRNATTHGVFSKATVLPHLGEDPATFDALLQNLQNELRPYSLVQEHQVRQIAQSLWRLRRLEQWERSVIGNAELPDAEQNKQWERILRLDSLLRRQIDRAYKLVRTEQKASSDAARQRLQERIDSGDWLPTTAQVEARAAAAKGTAPAPAPITLAPEPARETVSISALRHAKQNREQRRQGLRSGGE